MICTKKVAMKRCSVINDYAFNILNANILSEMSSCMNQTHETRNRLLSSLETIFSLSKFSLSPSVILIKYYQVGMPYVKMPWNFVKGWNNAYK